MATSQNEKRLLHEHLANRPGQEFGHSLVAHFKNHIGPVVDTPQFALSAKNRVYARLCLPEGKPYKLLFSIGMSFFHGAEAVICLPQTWPVERYYDDKYYFPDTLPLDIFRLLTTQSERKGSSFALSEGLLIDKTKTPWAKLSWPPTVLGFLLLDHSWSEPSFDEPAASEETVTIYTLIPIEESDREILKKKDRTAWLNERRHVAWETCVLADNPSIPLQRAMNDGLRDSDLNKVAAAIAAGAKVEGKYLDEHPSFGLHCTESYLEKALWSEQPELIKLLVENGASVPPHAIATVAGWARKAMFEYLMAKGADIDAADTMTALERARAFRNKEGYADLLSLGARRKKL